MVKAMLLILINFFTVWGICELIYVFRMLFFYPKIRVKNYSLIVLKSMSAVKQLNFIWQKLKWNGDAFSAGIIAFTDYLNINEILLCKDFAENKKIYLCTMSTFLHCKMIQGELFDGYR